MGIVPTGAAFRGFVIGEEGTPGRIFSSFYGVYITGESVYNTPERDSEMITIPGRNGALYRDKGRFENIDVTYHCGMFADSQQDFADNIRAFRSRLVDAALAGYDYLYDDYNPDEFRMAVFKEAFEVSPTMNSTAGEFDVVFNCKPQRFLKSGNTESTPASGGTVYNPSAYESQPLISFKTSGSGTITLYNQAHGSTQTITVTNAPTNTTIYIDCEVGEVYSKSGQQLISLNNYVSFGANVPVLLSGSTTVTYSNSITSLSIKPRWWRI